MAPRGRATTSAAKPGTPEVVDYAGETVRQIRATAGGERLWVAAFMTAPAMSPPPGVDHAYEPDEPLSLVENSDVLLRECVAMSKEIGGGLPFLQCQDDLILCQNAVGRIADVARAMDGAGLVSFYTPYAATRPFESNRVVPYPQDVYGTLCNLWHPAAAEEFLEMEHPKRAGAKGTGRHGTKGWDLMVQSWLRKSRWKAYRHVPCLVQHAGEVSSSGKSQGQRTTMNFKREWNARS